MKQSRYSGLIVISILILVAILLGGLQYFAQLPNRQKNGFTRKFLKEPLKPIRTLNLSVPLEKICGATDHNIFFSVNNPTWLIMIDIYFGRQDTIKLGLPHIKSITGANNVDIDSPKVTFFANNIPAIFQGRINPFIMDSVQLLSMPAFTRSTEISTEKAVVRGLTDSLDKQLFYKIDLKNGHVLSSAVLLPQAGKGGFENDGMLNYNKKLKSIFYVEYNRNRFYCIDTNLNLVYKANTIDTISHNTGEVQRIKLKNEEKYMPVKPRIAVNTQFCMSEEYVFIVSGLKADNESYSVFENNAVVDLYDIKTGKYSGSLHVPLNNEKVKSLYIRNNELIVLFSTHLSIFTLS